jgi:hypothetical protein
MTNEISEKDWKWLRSLRDTLLDRYCEQTLGKIQMVIATRDAKRGYEKYGTICDIIKADDEMLRTLFDDWRRSTALMYIAGLYKRGLFSNEEIAGFSEAVISYCK